MALPKGYEIKDDPKQYALKLKKNLYGQKQAGRVWNQYLTQVLCDNGFVQSQVDDCLFYYKRSVMMVYVDDTLLCGPTDADVDEIIAILATLFDVEDQGAISDYLGVKVEQLEDGRFKFTQPHLIEQFLNDLHLL